MTIFQRMVLPFLEEGNWQSLGAGELCAEVYFFGQWVFDLAGDNGLNKFYNPSGEPWTETVEEVLTPQQALSLYKLASEEEREEMKDFYLKRGQYAPSFEVRRNRK